MASTRTITVGARASPLAIAQTEEVLSQLRRHFPDRSFEVAKISTRGDRKKDSPLLSLGRGTFAKEIETALLAEEIDIAVHSAKDLPADLPDGLLLAGTVPRQDPRDSLVNRWALPLEELPAGARLGTSSPRRTAQLKAIRQDLKVLPIRGNVGTRLDKARGPDYDGVVVAAAGLIRLGRQQEVSEYLSVEVCTPDVGQGTLAVEVRTGDSRIREMLDRIDHAPTSVALAAERSFLSALGGGCSVPVAAYARVEGARLHISAMAGLPDGSRICREHGVWAADGPRSAGRAMAQALLDAGAREIL